ncbi:MULTISPECIES: cell division protein ZipA [Vibrio]|uniref:Cell division protein ZipA n=1 Tax=Vibrio casei TaxID=673372 RepID=A0A368LM11_9VIBR|nr:MULTISPECIES: cell division protein ZipA [Vibrio]RCS72835.1 cell division protein ZipA [Vibrio casei]SJN38907.1 Cell division protein ZipA [Vibrio casei]HBV74863.1 cell division protein ZipA [Vibrio sp.]
MQELRLVLIIVGGLAIVGLLVHGIWTSKKESKAKFADKPLKKMEPELKQPTDESITASSSETVERKEPGFTTDDAVEDNDPLFGNSDIPFSNKNKFSAIDESVEDVTPAFEQTDSVLDTTPLSEPITDTEFEQEQDEREKNPTQQPEKEHHSIEQGLTERSSMKKAPEPSTGESDNVNETDVIVFHVHAAGNTEFVGTPLFDSMKQNGLVYGAMDIFHRHTDISGTGKVLFSVANMMHPGTLAHDNPDTFQTKGISFFMALPCFGEPDQNFKLMLRTAQQIADDLGANVLDDKRNLMTPDRLSAYRQQIRDFAARTKGEG